MLYLLQEKIIFQPEKLSQDFIYSFSSTFEEFFIETKDGARLNAIHLRVKNPKGVILYFHGNKGNLNRWGEITSYFVKKGFAVIVMDYRTYGKSTGNLSEENLYKDAQLFYDYTLKYYSENEIILYGRSLGTGIATKIAATNKPRQLVLETPYYNMTDVVKHWVPVIPVGYIVKYRFPSNEFIQDVQCNITIYHGTSDGVVPYSSGEKLFNSISGQNKEIITIKGGSHNDLINFEGYTSTIESVLTK